MTSTDTMLEGMAGSISRALAGKLTRRSALTRIGRYGVALSLGSAGLGLLAEDANAHTCCSTCCCGNCSWSGASCCGSDSVWCSTLNGVNACPSGSCGCGSWVVGTCSNGQTLRYADCCGGCNNGSDCRCVSGAPSCCRHQLHTNGSCNDCGGNHIKCRRWFCS